MRSSTKTFKFCFLGLIFFCGLTVYLESIWKTGTRVWMKWESNTTCKIPKIDPFLRSTRFLIELADSLASGGRNYPICIGKEILFKVDHNSNLIRTGGNANFWEIFHCCYSQYNRSTLLKIPTVPQKIVKNGTEVCFEIRKNVTQIPKEHVNLDINCRNKSTQEIVYRYQLQNQRRTPKQQIGTPSRISPYEKLSILIIGLDGFSHANFLRYMPKTQGYLTQNLSAIEYHGLNKIGFGTFDNLIALLSGCKLNQSEPKSVDPSCELIWTEFSGQGYTTLHSEDYPRNAKTFYPVVRRNRSGIGVDYDNSEYLAVAHHSNNITHMYGTRGCFGDQFVYDVFTEEIIKTAKSLRNSPYFNFVWTTTINQEILRNVKYFDEPTYKLLVQMKTENLLNNTLLIILSDHGLSFGEYSKTSIGTVEGMMPLIYFVFPDGFKMKYKTAIANLELNSKRLSTPYDIHETLKDLLIPTQLEIENTARTVRLDARLGQSLFKPLPLNRTCEMANIPPKYCVCSERTELANPEKNSIIVQGADYAVTWLNSEISLYPMCESLKLSQIISAETLTSRVESDVMNDYEIVFKTIPNQGEFRAMMGYKSNNFKMIGEVTRVNAYNNQSACISEWANATYVKSICFCKH